MVLLVHHVEGVVRSTTRSVGATSLRTAVQVRNFLERHKGVRQKSYRLANRLSSRHSAYVTKQLSHARPPMESHTILSLWHSGAK